MKQVQINGKDDAIDFIYINYPNAWDDFHNWYDRRIENGENLPVFSFEPDEDGILDFDPNEKMISILDFEPDIFIGVLLRYVEHKSLFLSEVVDDYNYNYALIGRGYFSKILQFIIDAFRRIEYGNIKQLN